MWNAIKARHPTEAAKLASSSTVHAYQLPSPRKHPVQQSSEQATSQAAQLLQHPRDSSAEGLPEAHYAVAPPGVRTNTWESEPSEDRHPSTGFGLDWPALLQLSVRLRAAEGSAHTNTGSANSSAHVPLQQSSVRNRSSPVHNVQTAVPPHVEAASGSTQSSLQSASVSQPEVLRRAQASFADLRRIVQNVLTLGDTVNDPVDEPAVSDTSGTPDTNLLASVASAYLAFMCTKFAQCSIYVPGCIMHNICLLMYIMHDQHCSRHKTICAHSPSLQQQMQLEIHE